jgi:hypothetical protein
MGTTFLHEVHKIDSLALIRVRACTLASFSFESTEHNLTKFYIGSCGKCCSGEFNFVSYWSNMTPIILVQILNKKIEPRYFQYLQR